VATKRRVRRLTILLVASALLATAAGPAGGQAGAPAPPGREARGVAVTLLTGDKVILRQLAGERRSVHVIPAGRPGGPATFQTLSVRGDAYVLPSDVHALVGRLLDPALFNVSELARMGYGDAKAPSLPLIVQHTGTAKRPSPLAGVTRVWLDRRVHKTALDPNLTQIGARPPGTRA